VHLKTTVYPALTISRRRLTNGCDLSSRPPSRDHTAWSIDSGTLFDDLSQPEASVAMGPGPVAGTTMELT